MFILLSNFYINNKQTSWWIITIIISQVKLKDRVEAMKKVLVLADVSSFDSSHPSLLTH